MKILKGILLCLIILPWVFGFIESVDTRRGLIWSFLETGTYFPIYWLNEPFFKATEVGWLVTLYGKVLGSALYSVLLIAVAMFNRRQLTKH